MSFNGIYINHMKRILLSFLIPLIFISCKEKAMSSLDLLKNAEKSIQSITVLKARKLILDQSIIIIDVRTKEEYDKGHIKNAIHISRGLLEFEIEQKVQNKNSKLLVYCQVGGRSALAVETLKRMGYKNAYNLSGGYMLWLQ